ncbi:MAG: hypothetical protein AVDCRST_MAG56-2353 [uncultured Cytophagales bacterium]|uniref:Uncharacterized protein n=1 Tax=uncultured Cytophagales bacterium TaxID=158755 RepID=A0A6J4GZ81_9SPHI|nr:MAG: hypothetical protein AVDCRST_MAG56-2353 [uncultured Cytophagales bacterium]
MAKEVRRAIRKRLWKNRGSSLTGLLQRCLAGCIQTPYLRSARYIIISKKGSRAKKMHFCR